MNNNGYCDLADSEAQLECQLKRSTRWVWGLLALQLWMGIFFLDPTSTGLLALIINSVFVGLGVTALRQRHQRLLTGHFMYSMVIYIFCAIAAVIGLCFSDVAVPFLGLVLAIVIILFQAISLRHERIVLRTYCILNELAAQRSSAAQTEFETYPDVHVEKPVEGLQEKETAAPQPPFYVMPSFQYQPVPTQMQMQYPMQYPMVINPQDAHAMPHPVPHPMYFMPYGLPPMMSNQVQYPWGQENPTHNVGK